MGPEARAARRRPGQAPLSGARLAPLLIGAGGALVLVALAAACVGPVTVPLGDTWRTVVGHLTGDTGGLDPALDQIVWGYRLPRVVLALLCGAGLSVAGVVLQALVNNPLADPYVLGLSSGASFGAVLVIVGAGGVIGGLGTSFAAFLGAALAITLVFALGQQRGRLAPTRVVLAGVAVGYLLLAATSYLQLRANPNELRQVVFWSLGSVAGATWDQLGVVTAVVLISVGVLLLHGRRLNALGAGDEQATALGVDVRALRIGLLALSSLVTGVLIAAAGGIGFVGLMVPHLVRLTVGLDHRRVLPLAALVGATYLVVVDLLSRTVDPPNELPIGIFTAAFGAPFFLWLLRRNQSIGAGT
ncbi:iron ABC transporter permease [Actinokineospora sp. PR83]|uniref:FecCD family ABC transporter permease n=1 Tax=Actinokineospora sp. PR83 TaxID=2884908 RepID=UPI001F4486F8|nr:iron ABC transporter permease [Actinokineospora sp. PR83]MCG8914472.1 iron ABC transporter permease [Actinokineospora sp. PR83]